MVRLHLLTSRILLDELAATLAKKKLLKYAQATGLTADQMLASYWRIATLVTADDSAPRSRAMPTMTTCSRSGASMASP